MDWPRLHAAMNDLPAALLLASVLFDVLGLVVRRDSLRAAGFWSLVAGVAGALLAIGSGLMAEDMVAHDDAAHQLMEWHENLAYVVLGVFGPLLLWRLLRRTMARIEGRLYLAAGMLGIVFLVAAARVGGALVFDHGLGVHLPAVTADSAATAADDSTRSGHEHAPGTAPHEH